MSDEAREKFEQWIAKMFFGAPDGTQQGLAWMAWQAAYRAGEIAQQDKIADLEHEIEYAHSALGGNRSIHLHDKIFKLKEQFRGAAPEQVKP